MKNKRITNKEWSELEIKDLTKDLFIDDLIFGRSGVYASRDEWRTLTQEEIDTLLNTDTDEN